MRHTKASVYVISALLLENQGCQVVKKPTDGGLSSLFLNNAVINAGNVFIMLTGFLIFKQVIVSAVVNVTSHSKRF